MACFPHPPLFDATTEGNMTEFLHEKGMDLSYRHHLVISMTVFQMNV